MVGFKTYNIFKDYKIDRNLGFGSYGEVKLGIHLKSKREVAIKKIPLSNASQEVNDMINNEVLTLIECVTSYQF